MAIFKSLTRLKIKPKNNTKTIQAQSNKSFFPSQPKSVTEKAGAF